MRLFWVVLVICLLGACPASAKAASSSGSSAVLSPVVNPYITSVIATTGVSYCSDDPATSSTDIDLGDLNVAGSPAGASISVDGSPFGRFYCSGYPPVCINTIAVVPSTNPLIPGTHSITVSADGYKSYLGTVYVCAQKVTYVSANLAALPVATVAATTAEPTAAVTTEPALTTPVTTIPAATTPAASSTTLPVPVRTTTAAETVAAVVPAQTPGSAGTGSLSVATTPSGATIFIDGVLRGASPATIPGIPAGSHTLLLKRDGYQDMSVPVTITAGTTQEYATTLVGNPVTTRAADAAAGTPVTPKKSPGSGWAAVLAAVGFLALFRR